MTVAQLKGVRIDRAKFLRAELRSIGVGEAVIDNAIASTPLQAGIPLEDLDRLATKTINFETRRSASMSFAAGIPGGIALAATVPADVTQYFFHAF